MSAIVRLAVLGDPLAYTRSPDLHRAGCAAVGIACESRAWRTSVPELPARLSDLAAEGYAGCNLTMPLKEPGLGAVARASDAARRTRSVNTVTFAEPGGFGETTDGPGFVAWLRELGHDPTGLHVVLLGAGGACRSLGGALAEAGAAVTVSARQPELARAAWVSGAVASFVGWRSADEAAVLADADVVVNGTPLGGPDGPVEPARLGAHTHALDLVYGPELTAWVSRVRASGRPAHDGLGLLVHQARLSLGLWLGREVPVAPLARAVGWPR